MKSHGNQILFTLRIIGVILGLGFLAYQIFSSLNDFNWSILTPNTFINIILSLVLIIFAIALQMTAWKLILGDMNHHIAILDVFSGFSLSFVARLIPGTIWGYVTRGEWLKREHNTPYAITNFSSIIETVGYLTANLFIVVQGFLFIRNISFSFGFIIILIIGSWALLNLIILWNPSRKLLRLDQNKIIRFPLPMWTVIFFLFIGMWYLYGVGLLIFSSVFGVHLSMVNAVEMSALYALAWFIGFIVPFLPSGLGLREFSLTVLLVALFNLTRADAALVAIGFRILVSIAELFWIGFGLTKKTILGVNRKIIL
jgi:glycosyltransferase 2 family protein